MHKILITLVVLASFCAVATLLGDDAMQLPKTQAALAAHKPVKIVCLGDSVTGIYYHTGGRRAYPEMIAVGLKQIDPDAQVTVVNAGISGHTTANGLARLQTDVLDHKPHLVTVMFGLNDMKRIPLADFQANLKTIIERCRGVGAEVLLCTPNGVIDTADRPRAKLAEYNQAMQEVGRQTKTPVCDVYAAYEALRASDGLAFRLLCSDEIHPNMAGHKLNAETICQTITGKKASLADAGPPEPALARTRQLLKDGKPVRVLAMPPYDGWIAAALQAASPDAKIEVTRWETKDQTLNQLHTAAKAIRQMSPRPDLVIVAIPLAITPPLSKPDEAAIADQSWILNYSLSFGVQEWDVIGVSPSLLQAKLTADEQDRDAFCRRMFGAQDLPLITRPADNGDEAEAIFRRWFR
jgi:lysophospholipase L1-like esterase